jgi:hypothetical protein
MRERGAVTREMQADVVAGEPLEGAAAGSGCLRVASLVTLAHRSAPTISTGQSVAVEADVPGGRQPDSLMHWRTED